MSTTPPVIGISAYCEVAKWGVWDQRAALIPQNYVDQVAAAGGVPVLLPPVPGVELAVSRLDGLILSGGPDLEPASYGQEPGPRTTVIRPERDAAETALFLAAARAGLPILGICRGMQLINVALGGTLIQHLPDVVGHEGHCQVPGQMGTHEVTVASGGLLADIVGAGPLAVPTYHHQAIDRLAAGLTATAWSDDGTIEAVELDHAQAADEQRAAGHHRFTLAVQWHPEADQDRGPLFRALVAAAAEHASLYV